jgi:hypothetical protein
MDKKAATEAANRGGGFKRLWAAIRRWFLRKPPSPFDSLWRGLSAFIGSESLMGNFAKAGVVLGLVTLIGAMGMAVRLDFARVAYQTANGGNLVGQGLPVEGGLAVVPHATLLIEGTLDLIGSLVLALALLFIASRTRWVAILIAFAVLLVVPRSWAGLFWPAAILLVAILLTVSSSDPLATWPTKTLIASTVTVVIAIGIVVARYADPPTHFAMGNVWTINSDIPSRPSTCPQIPEQTSTTLRCADGLFLGADDNAIYVGRPGAKEIIGVPRDTVKELRLLNRHEPYTRPYPPASLLARLFGEDFSLTPYSIWWQDKQILGTWQG